LPKKENLKKNYKKTFPVGLSPKNAGTNIVHKSYIQTDQNLPKNGIFPTTDKYSAVFTEYLVAKYSAGHYSAEY
jgi:hypothetical protein